MGIFSKLFGSSSRYDDAQIVQLSQTALSTDPMIDDPSSVEITSKNGVITVGGVVQKQQEMDRIEGVIRNALTTKSLRHERIVNELKLPQSG
jgi:hypothetical protein